MALGATGCTEGKSVALQVLSTPGGPNPAEDPGLWRALREAQSILTTWRLAYNLPPTDPRVAEVTEEEALHDLLVRHYASRGGDGRPSLDEVMSAGSDLSRELLANAKRFLAAEETRKRLLALHGTTVKPAGRPLRLRRAPPRSKGETP